MGSTEQLTGSAAPEPPTPDTPAPVRAWTHLIGSTLARAVLAAIAGLLLWAALPAVWGWHPTTVASDSMAPRIKVGDVVIADPSAERRLGQVLLVEDPNHDDRLRLHRLEAFDVDGMLVLRGDANQQADSTPVSDSAVVGVGMIRVPWVGLPGLWLSRGDVLPLILLTAAGVGMGALSRFRAPPTAGIALGLAVMALVAPSVVVSAPESRAGFQSATGSRTGAMAAASPFPCFTAPPADSPSFAYRFSEPDGTSAVDSSPNARAGSLQGGATRVAGSCPPGTSPFLTLDGSSGFVTTPGPVAAPAVFSTEIWFRTTTNRGGRLIGFGDSAAGVSTSADRQLYMTNSGTLVAGLSGVLLGPLTPTSPKAYNDGQWHHAVVTSSQLLDILGLTTTLRLYVDGVQVASSGALLTPTSYSGYWRIGHDTLAGWPSAPASRYFSGAVDSVAVYPAPLSAAQVAAHFSAGR